MVRNSRVGSQVLTKPQNLKKKKYNIVDTTRFFKDSRKNQHCIPISVVPYL